MTLLPRFDQESALNELVNNPFTTQPPNPIATLDGFESVQLAEEVSRVISASQLTTIFTSISPRRTAEGAATTESVVSQDPLPAPNFQKLIEIGIVFVVLVAVTIIVLSIFLYRRHRSSVRLRNQREKEPKTIDYKNWQYVDVQAPAEAHVASGAQGRPPTRGRDGHQEGVSQGGLPPAYSAGHNANPMSAPRWR